MAAAPFPKFSPLFMHCKISRVHIDGTTKSELYPVQANGTLDPTLDLVQNTKITPARIITL
jgi:hypothetical protein